MSGHTLETAGADRPLPVVGVGASAGGLDALQVLLAGIPERSGFAIVIVQHVEPNVAELLPALLGAHAPVPVTPIVDGMRCEANCIYVAPARQLVSLKSSKFVVEDPDDAGERWTPVDHFFESLAEDQLENAVGVVLSGTGSDGSLGIKAISNRGGLALAQDADSAKYEAMPGHAARSGVIDYVLAPSEMAAHLLRYAAHLRGLSSDSAANRPDRVNEELDRICDILLRRTRQDFKHYKVTTLVRRILRRMQVLQIDSASRYAERLEQDPEEQQSLFNDLLIGVTAFFRDAEAFQALAQKVIPKMLNRDPEDQVRIWVPGCAGGEEAYTIAMLVSEAMDAVRHPPKVQIFATDVAERGVTNARQGLYPEGIAEYVSAERLERFFVKRGRRYQVAKEIRDLCLFSVHNLITDPPFSRLDLISCRNVLIYMGAHLQTKLMGVFHYALRTEGYLFLGTAESVGQHGELFDTVDAKHRIAQRKHTSIDPGPQRRAGAAAARPVVDEQGSDVDVGRIAQRMVLDEFAPKYAIIDESGQLIHLSGGMGPYLEPAEGPLENNVLRMIRPGLRVGLRAALADAASTKRRVTHGEVSVRIGSEPHLVRVTIQPMPELAQATPLYLLVLHDWGVAASRESLPALRPNEEASVFIDQLERELALTRRDLENSIQDLEASNEELKSSNEELLSMNEELQSANEELLTSKEEIQASREALERAYSDVENLLESTRMAVIFLDMKQRVRSFTPAVTEVCNLIPGDVGRPLAHTTHRFVNPPDLPSLEQLTERGGLIEQELTTDDGRWYLRRTLPYRRRDGVIDGLVVTYVDVSQLKEFEMRFRATFENAAVGIGHLGSRGEWLRVNDRLCEIVGYARRELLSKTFDELLHASSHSAGRAMRELFEGKRPSLSAEERLVKKDGSAVWVNSTSSVVRSPSGEPAYAIVIIEDIEARKNTEAALRASQSSLEDAARQKDEFLAILSHELRNPLAPIHMACDLLRMIKVEDASVDRVRDVINRQVGHMARLLDELLDVSRIARGKIKLQLELADVHGLLRTVCEDHRALLEQSGLSFECEFGHEPLWIMLDVTRFAQIVGNLLHNACKFTERNGTVTLTLTRDGGQAVVTIRDTGIGMDAATLAHAFEPFRQADTSLDRSRGGLGLGLSVVKGLIELHGGTIAAASEGPGRGTTVVLRVPLVDPPSQSRAVPRKEAEFVPKRVLVVDDNRDTVELMASMLELEGYQVAVAHNGAEALERALEFSPNVVVCDIGLPGMSGYELARALRSKLPKSVRLVAITGYGSGPDRSRAFDAGFDEHLTKPVGHDVLRRVLRD